MIRVRLDGFYGGKMKSGVIFGNTDKLFDAERRWEFKRKRSSIAESDERI